MLAVFIVTALLAVQGHMALSSGSHASYCMRVEEANMEYATFASYLAPENGYADIQGPSAYRFSLRINYCKLCSNNVTVRIYRGHYSYNYVPGSGSSLITRSHTSVSITAFSWGQKFITEAPGKQILTQSFFHYNLQTILSLCILQ